MMPPPSIRSHWLRKLQWVVIALAAVCAPSASAQPVRADVLVAGFPTTASASGYSARAGQWCPVLVRLAAQGTEPISCVVVCEQRDGDGDRVLYRSPSIVANPTPRDVWLYIAPSFSGSEPVTVRIESAAGETLTRIEAQAALEAFQPDDMLVLDVSKTAFTPLQDLESTPGSGSSLGRTHYYDTVVSRMEVGWLPDRWIGLEPVDVLIWDQPAPAQLDPAQVEAVIDWVRRGGHLIVGLGDAWQQVRASPLAAILPVEGPGGTISTTALPAFLRAYASSDVLEFKAPIAVADVRQARGWTILTDQAGEGTAARRTVPLITTNQVDSGRVTVVAASLRDLSARDVKLRGKPLMPLLMTLLDLNFVPERFRAAEASSGGFAMAGVFSLYDGVVRPIEFQQLGGLLLLIAIVFVAAYVLLATFASWAWLTRLQRTSLSWSAFAGSAVLASGLSLAAVQLTRGCPEVAAVSVVDLAAGESDVHGNVWFGYKSAGRQTDDLSLPSEPNRPASYLRPLASSALRMDSPRYATPVAYGAQPSKAALDDVLMRSTLKQFEGAWSGVLPGTIGGRLTASRTTGRLSATSYIDNGLPDGLEGGVILYIDPRLEDSSGDVPLRPFGLDRAYRNDYLGSREVPAAVNVLAVTIGPIAAGGRLSSPGADAYTKLDEALGRWQRSAAEPRMADRPEPATLWHSQVLGWMPTLGVGLLSGPADSLMLASTRRLFLNTSGQSPQPLERVGTPISSEGLPDIDISSWLMRNQAVLLVWRRGPGPVDLLRNGQAMRTASGLTLYRVRMPIAYEGAVARESGRDRSDD